MKTVAVISPFWTGHRPTWVGALSRRIKHLGHRPIVLCPKPHEVDVEARRFALAKFPSVSPGGVRTLLRKTRLLHVVKRAVPRDADLLFFPFLDHYAARLMPPQLLSLILAKPFAGLLFYAPWWHGQQAFAGHFRSLLGARAVGLLDETILEPAAATFRRVHWIPDNLEPPAATTRGALYRRLRAFARGRRLIVCAGALTRRKGVETAVEFARRSPDVAVALCGRLDLVDFTADERARLQRLPENVAVEHRWLSDDELDDAVAAADLVWLVYRDHFGSSGILVRAAQLRRRVLAADNPPIAARVDQHQLGAVVRNGLDDAVERALHSAPDFDGYLQTHSRERCLAAFDQLIASALD